MVRPKKYRIVEFFPNNSYYIPLGKEKCEIQEVILKVEELEAMRLKDLEGLNQEECAKKMNVSRQTFQNIIDNARRNVAIALTEGKAIKIDGGHYTTENCKFICKDCGEIYDISYEQDRNTCISCKSSNVSCKKKFEMCRKWCSDKKTGC